MGHARQTPSRSIRLLFTLLFVLVMFGDSLATASAQDVTPTTESPPPPTEQPLVESSPTTSPMEVIPTETPFDLPTSTATVAEMTIELNPTEPAPSEPAATQTTVPSSTPVPPTATETATAANPFAGTADQTGVRVTIKEGGNFGPLMAGVCMSLWEMYLDIYSWTGCTDESGSVFLPVIGRFEGAKNYRVDVSPPFGYQEPDSRMVGISWGFIAETTIFVQPRPLGSETLNAVDGGNGAPLGGACWTYFENLDDAPGDSVIGPVCDSDNDGVVTVSDIPYEAYCLVATAPSGYVIVGSDPICSPPADRTFSFTKAFVTNASPANGSVSVHAHTTWDADLAQVCPRLLLILGGNRLDVGGGCTDANGNLTITGLPSGSYLLVNGAVPNRFEPVADNPITVANGAAISVDLTVVATSSGDSVAKAVFGYGPDTLPGACWTIETSVNLKPGGVIVVGPVCDTDGDGITIIPAVPYGAFCHVVYSPPPGFERDGEDFVCLENMRSGKLTVGFTQIRPTATATRTPGPTWTPSATSTAIPTPPPVGNEPNTGLVVRYCHQSQTFDQITYFTLCKPAPAGITFNVIQNGTIVDTTTTLDSGVAAITLDERIPFQLAPASGYGSEWTSGAGEEEKTRYGAAQQFHFEPAASVDRTWTMRVRVKEWNFWNGNGYSEGPPIPGACFRIIGADDIEYLPEVCDTDNDGLVIVGQLPPRLDSSRLGFYRAVMTVAPTGYYLRSQPQFGSAPVTNPNEWTTTYEYWKQELQIRTVDPDGNPVAGFCFRTVPRVLPSGSGLVEAKGDCDYHGLTRIPNPQELLSLDQRLTMTSSAPGYLPDVWYQDLIINPADTIRAVTFVVRPYGTFEPDQASARLRFRDHDQILPRNLNHGLICGTLSPNTGFPQGEACEGQNQSEILFRNLDPGSYTVSLTSEREDFCAVPPTVTFEITEADLGTEKIVTVQIPCGSGATCTVFRENPGRSVDLYLGAVYDPDGNRIDAGLTSSETLAWLLIRDLLDRVNPDPARINEATLAPWIESWGDGGSSWAVDADYDGDARQRLLDSWAGYGEIDVSEPSLLGSYQIVSGVSLEDLLLSIGEVLPDYPECDNRTWVIMVLRTFMATVNVYEMDAHQVAPEEPSATLYPTQEPTCDTVVTRNLTAYFGALRDTTGNVLLDALALSDRIPVALRDAIRAAQSPGEVRALISNWMDQNLLPEEWGFSTSDGLDPATDLIDQYRTIASEVTPGTPSAGEAITYEYQSYRLYDVNELPENCIAPDDPSAGISPAGLGRLIPILQTTRVQVTWYELNAVASGTIQPTATSTATPDQPETPDIVDPTETASVTPETADPTVTGTPDAIDQTETAVAGATDEPQPSSTPAGEKDDDVMVTQLPNTGTADGSASAPGARATLVIVLLAFAGLGLARRSNRRART